MKVLLINGSPREHGCTYTALSEVEKVLHKHEIETEILYLGKEPISGCTACRSCNKTGVCIFDDIVNETAARISEFDGMIIGSPVYYAAPNGHLIAFLDRLFFSAGDRMATKLGASVLSCRRAGSTAAFDQLNKYFTISNMPIVSSQYWNQVHGQTPEDVMKDEEGLQIMRTLGENTAWLLRCIDCARKNGVAEPNYETKVATNFIR